MRTVEELPAHSPVEQAKRLGYEPIRRSTAVSERFGVAGVLTGAVSSDLKWLGILAAIGIAE